MKRMFDIASSFLLLIILFPIAALITGMILLDMGLPILFKQRRPGQYGKTFHLYKFRTMDERINMDDGEPLADRHRLTRVGRFLRKYSLDELPQLLNVIIGDMSLVGPRPLLVEYLPLYTVEQNKRHHVKPGITGWAQINGRNTVTWEEKFEMDQWYVDNRCFRLDGRILLGTVGKVIKKQGITQQGHVSMEKFTGTKDGL